METVPLVNKPPQCPRGYHWVPASTLQAISPTSFYGQCYIATLNDKGSWNPPEKVTITEAQNTDSTYLAITYAKKKPGYPGITQLAWQEFTTNKIALACLDSGEPKKGSWRRFLCC